MKKLQWLVGVLAFGAVAGHAQGSSDPEKDLHDALVGKQKYMRGFSADDTVQWKWDGATLVMETPQIRTIGVLTVSSVAVREQKVAIKGTRQTLLRGEGDAFELSAQEAPVEIKIDLRGAPMPAQLAMIAGQLFYPNRAASLADIPVVYRHMLPARGKDAEATLPKSAANGSTDCTNWKRVSALERLTVWSIR